MKIMLFLVFLLVLIGASWGEEAVFSHDFSSGMPAGWTVEGAPIWGISNSNNAGREVPELLCWPDGSEYTARYISPAYNTTGYQELRFYFWHGLQTAGPENYTLKVQVSADLVNWDTVWNLSGTEEIPGQYVSMNIPRAYLDTSTFHIAFVVEGYISIAWYIDNPQLNIVSRIVTGTWTAAGSPYYLLSNQVVPEGSELVIEPGVEVIGSYQCGIYVYGDIEAQGTASDPIVFTSDGNMQGWGGITLQNMAADEIGFSHCVFENCWKDESSIGGALNIVSGWTNILIENCRFTNNYAGDAGALSIQGGWHTYIQNCLFERNSSSGMASAFYAEVNERCYFYGNAFIINQFMEGTNRAHAILRAVSLYTHLNLNNLTFAHNYGGDAALLICGEDSQGMFFGDIYAQDSIFWDSYIPHEVLFEEAFGPGRTGGFNYCDIDPARVFGTTPVFTNCINVDPLFISTYDCHLLGNSPCVNTGQQGAYDPDGTRKDMGAFPIYAKPVIAAVNDVPWDQGRQVEVFWDRSGMDNIFMPNAFYSVWRGDSFRGNGGTVIASPSELASLSSLDEVWWMDRDVAWLYIGQCPAYNFENYAYICPTLQDSSSTGTNAVPFRVVYQWNAGFSASAEVSGYSVDNIPPDAVRNLAIVKETGNLRLQWSPVSSGTCNGSSYPELNGVYYLIYASDEPDFLPGPESYLGITSQTFRIEEHLGHSQRFFRVVSTDQM
jgi:hypothetical protein